MEGQDHLLLEGVALFVGVAVLQQLLEGLGVAAVHVLVEVVTV